jgi:hypothetical protein
MSYFPRGGDLQATRIWLDKNGFLDVFEGWQADALLGKYDEYVKSKFPEASVERAEMLTGLLNTARQSTGNLAMHITCNNIPIFDNVSHHRSEVTT